MNSTSRQHLRLIFGLQVHAHPQTYIPQKRKRNPPQSRDFTNRCHKGKLETPGTHGIPAPLEMAVPITGHLPSSCVGPVHPTGMGRNQSQSHDRSGETQRRHPGTWGWPEGGEARGWRRHCSRSSVRWSCCCRCLIRHRSPSTGHRRLHGTLARERRKHTQGACPQEQSKEGSKQMVKKSKYH